MIDLLLAVAVATAWIWVPTVLAGMLYAAYEDVVLSYESDEE